MNCPICGEPMEVTSREDNIEVWACLLCGIFLGDRVRERDEERAEA